MSKFTGKDTNEFYDEMVQLGMRGLTLEECGNYHALSPADWSDWCKAHPLTEARYKTGKARGVALAGQELLRQVQQGKINAITFYLKTQGTFAEKATIPVPLVPPAPLPIPTLPTDSTEAARIYKQFMQDS